MNKFEVSWDFLNDVDQGVMHCWAILDDLQMIIGHPDCSPEMEEKLEALRTLYEMKFSKLNQIVNNPFARYSEKSDEV